MEEIYLTQENKEVKLEQWKNTIKNYTYPRPQLKLKHQNMAIMIIDMQNYFANSDGRSYLPATKTIIPNLKELAALARKSGVPLLYTRHGHSDNLDLGMLGKFWGDYIKYGEWDWNIIEELAPSKNDKIFDKTRYDAFYNTGLEEVLNSDFYGINRSITQLVITGVMTHLCCETTARSAFVRDFEVYFTIDGTASSCEQLHLSTLINLSNGFAIPVTVADVVNSIIKHEKIDN